MIFPPHDCGWFYCENPRKTGELEVAESGGQPDLISLLPNPKSTSAQFFGLSTPTQGRWYMTRL